MKNNVFIFFSLMLMSCIIDVTIPPKMSALNVLYGNVDGDSVAVTAHSITREALAKQFATGTPGAAGANPAMSESYYGTLAGLRALTDADVKTAYISDYGTGIFAQDPLDNSSADNTWQTVVAASGKRYKRQWDGLRLQVEWFGAKGDGITEDTNPVQVAVNAAYKKELVFNKTGIYVLDKINIPSGIKLNGNGCKIRPPADIISGGVWYIDVLRNDPITGLYTGVSKPVYRPNIKKVYDIEISGFDVDFCMVRLGFFIVSAGSAFNTIFDKIEIHDNVIRNFVINAIQIATDGRVNDSTCVISKIQIEKNDIRYNGMAGGLAVDAPRFAGDTTVKIFTVDHYPIEGRLKSSIGKYFWFGSPIVSQDTLDNYGYNTTNTIFRLKTFTIDEFDSSKADIEVEGGAYDATNGWIKFTDNTGLRARIARNNMVIPVDNIGKDLLRVFPQFNGTTGATTLTRSISSPQQDAYHRNLIVGMKFYIQGQKREYTITGITPTTIDITPGLLGGITNTTLLSVLTNVDGISISGNIQDTRISGNTVYGATHFLGYSQAAVYKQFADEQSSKLLVENNTWWYCWMGLESPNLTPRVSGYIPFNNIATVKGDTSFIPVVASRIGTKDMGSGPVKFLTASANTDPNVTLTNSYFVGDILAWVGDHYRYIINDFYEIGGQVRVSIRRFDTYNKVALNMGFDATNGDISTCFRLFNPELGEIGMPNYMGVINNYGYYTMRNAGNGGYHISCLAYTMDIIGNHFYNTQADFEPQAVNMTVADNKIYNKVFDGSEPVPSITAMNGGSPPTHGGWGTIMGSRVDIKNNIFSGVQPDNYAFTTGYLLYQPAMIVLHPGGKYSINTNTFTGVAYQLLNSVNSKTIEGKQYNRFYFDLMEVTNNTINITANLTNTGWANNMLAAKKVIIQNNTITTIKNIPYLNVFRTISDRPNPELFDTTARYDIRIENNYDTLGNLNSPYLEAHAGVFWNDNRPTLNRVETFTNKTLDNPSLNNIGGSGNNLIYNPVTKKIERTTLTESCGCGTSLKGTTY